MGYYQAEHQVCDGVYCAPYWFKSFLKISYKTNGMQPILPSIPQLVSLFLSWNPSIPPFHLQKEQSHLLLLGVFIFLVLFVVIVSINGCNRPPRSDSTLPLFAIGQNFNMGQPRTLGMWNVRKIITIHMWALYYHYF